MKFLNKNAFTLVELLIVIMILTIVLTGLIKLFLDSSVLAEMSGNKTAAIGEAQTKIEEIQNHEFDTITSAYSQGGIIGNTFDTSLLSGKGVVYINSSNTELLEIEVVICWRDKYGRIIGEDINLNGVLDTDEDKDGNGKIDSIVKLRTMITRR